MDAKYAIIFDADTDNVPGAVRALHTLVAALSLLQRSGTVEMIFDGPGVQWLAHFRRDDGPGETRLAALFDDARQRGLSWRACSWCAQRYEVYRELSALGEPLDGDPDGHPCIAPLVVAGYQIIHA